LLDPATIDSERKQERDTFKKTLLAFQKDAYYDLVKAFDKVGGRLKKSRKNRPAGTISPTPKTDENDI